MTARLDARPSTRLVRASRDYRLAQPEELPLETRQTLERSMPAGQLAGVLVSRAGGLADRAVDQAGAALFRHLVEPVDAVETGLVAADLVAPVLDGVLEIESDTGWVSGPSAYRMLDLVVPSVGDDGCSVASVTALRRAARFGGRDVTAAWVRLYCSGRLPMSAAWADRLRVAGGVERFATSGAGRALRRHWSGPGSDDAKGWLIWRHLDPSRRRAVSWGEKLYVGVRPDAVPAAVAAVAAIGGEVGLPAFKIAAQPIGLRRSDKIVLYCQDATQRDQLGRRLARALEGADPQPVPFTSALVPTGLVSWGSDPPDHVGPPDVEGGQSWRTWLCQQLAESLVAAVARPAPDLAPHEFALGRLAVEGVDPRTFTPSDDLWGAA